MLSIHMEELLHPKGHTDGSQRQTTLSLLLSCISNARLSVCHWKHHEHPQTLAWLCLSMFLQLAYTLLPQCSNRFNLGTSPLFNLSLLYFSHVQIIVALSITQQGTCFSKVLTLDPIPNTTEAKIHSALAFYANFFLNMLSAIFMHFGTLLITCELSS